MRKIITIVLFIITTITLSCSSDSTSNTTTDLEGVWRLQNIPSGAKLTFEGQNWKLNSGTVEMSGTFTLTNDLMSGQVDYRSGQGSDLIQPDTFTGNVDIENNKVTFTNFSGNWFAPFSSWYQKQ
ncbi:MAG: hypothetical protein ACH34V_11185 [Flavobacterium sp.]|uniref:hypothetical protein n=1 Tax=Flavobacterium sp. TaxID=239 RepID=UPI0037B502FE